jgi:hypothetical protein
MPTSFDVGDFLIWDSVSGDYEPLCDVKELSTISDKPAVTMSDDIPIMRSGYEISGMFKAVTGRSKLKRIAYGWTAKGPVRVKAIMRAYKLRREHAEH